MLRFVAFLLLALGFCAVSTKCFTIKRTLEDDAVAKCGRIEFLYAVEFGVAFKWRVQRLIPRRLERDILVEERGGGEGGGRSPRGEKNMIRTLINKYAVDLGLRPRNGGLAMLCMCPILEQLNPRPYSMYISWGMLLVL